MQHNLHCRLTWICDLVFEFVWMLRFLFYLMIFFSFIINDYNIIIMSDFAYSDRLLVHYKQACIIWYQCCYRSVYMVTAWLLPICSVSNKQFFIINTQFSCLFLWTRTILIVMNEIIRTHRCIQTHFCHYVSCQVLGDFKKHVCGFYITFHELICVLLLLFSHKSLLSCNFQWFMYIIYVNTYFWIRSS